jgi:hypothetical protein
MSRSTCLWASALLLGVPLFLWACAVAPPRGQRIEIADETAILVWDARSKTQHFIRRASFENTSGAKDFGFLVPTPSYPELKEASDEAFKTLEKLTAPRTVTKRKEVLLLPQIGCPGAKAPKETGVSALHEQRVAGYDAVVLEVRKAEALSGWLKERGYDFAPDLKDWVAPYVKRGWKVTAFKVGRDEKGERLATSAVRMTFPADEPFFPYREPAEAPQARRRRLRVYFVADARYRGALGDAAWPGEVVWFNSVDEETRAKVLRQVKLPGDTGPEEWRLTEFEDTSSPRQGNADVTFVRDGNQETVERTPNVVYTEPSVLDYVLAALVQWSCCYGPFLLLGVWWLWRRRRRS